MITTLNNTLLAVGTSTDSLIKFSLLVTGRYNAEYSAFIYMTPADYQKYFCKGRENEDPAALALEDWKEVQCVVPELSGYCSQDAGNVEVSILSREQISNSSFEPYEDDDEHLWDKLTDRAGIPWQEARRFREEITANVTSFITNPTTNSPILLELYASVDQNPFIDDDDSAVMLLEDYRKYFCPAGVDPIAHAKKAWDGKEAWYYFANYELTATTHVYTYTDKDIRDGKFTETESGDFETTLWDRLKELTNDDAPTDWNTLRKTLQQNVKNLLSPSASTVTVTYEIPADKLDLINAYVESIGGIRLT